MEVQDRMSFKGAIAAGTRVKMSEQGKKTWHNEEVNPHDMVGVVLDKAPFTLSDYGFVNKVAWENGYTNSYQAGELEEVAQTDIRVSAYDKLPTTDFIDIGWGFPTLPYFHVQRKEGDKVIKLVLGADSQYAMSCNFTKADVAMLIDVLKDFHGNMKGMLSHAQG